MARLRPIRGEEKTLRPIMANVGIELLFRRQLEKLIKRMHDSVMFWTKASYKQADPATLELAQDEAPVRLLARSVRELRTRWLKQFDTAADSLADYFATDMAERTDAALRKALRDGGFSVKFKMTPAARDIVNATMKQQVSLIKSIPRKYLDDVEGAVMRSVQTGRDLASLTKDLQKSYGVTRRRAALIARDQNNKATSAITRARQTELGLNKAVWRHSAAGKEPRPAHEKMDGREYDVRKGMWDPDEKKYIWPGELINCRCYSVPVVPGF